jgi:HD-like signal output (HDOD) protein
MIEREAFCNDILVELESGKLVLPTLPEVALRVNDVAENPDVSISELADVIGTDAALSAQLLKVANSLLYRGRYPVDSVQMAISRLGLKLVKNIVSSLIMEQMFQAPSKQLEDRLHALWQHSVDVAAIAHVLAAKHPGIPADEAMLAGLIHEIGVLPILLKAENRPKLLQDTALLDSVIHDLSTRIGVAILESWSFPQSLIAVVAEHENYHRDSTDGPDLVDVVQVANLQSHFNTSQSLTEEELPTVPAFKKLGVQTEVHVVELEENSEDYTEALALFGQIREQKTP